MRRRNHGSEHQAARVTAALLADQLQYCLATISARELEVIELLFGLKDGYVRTYDEAAAKLGMSRGRVRQIASKAMNKLRDPSRSQVLEGYLDGEDGLAPDVASSLERLFRARLESQRDNLPPLVKCGRHGWSDPMSVQGSRQTCKQCPCPVSGAGSGRPRKYCSPACRQAAYRQRSARRPDNRPAANSPAARSSHET
jgi:DNA-binding CsgD family transcriptional regulator